MFSRLVRIVYGHRMSDDFAGGLFTRLSRWQTKIRFRFNMFSPLPVIMCRTNVGESLSVWNFDRCFKNEINQKLFVSHVSSPNKNKPTLADVIVGVYLLPRSTPDNTNTRRPRARPLARLRLIIGDIGVR